MSNATSKETKTMYRATSFLSALAASALMIALLGASVAQAEFGLIPGTFTGKAFDESGTVEYTQAGGHPHEAVAHFELNFHPAEGDGLPDGNIRNVIVDVPPGFVGDPSAVPRCPEADWHARQCSTNNQVGIAVVHGSSNIGNAFEPIYNLEPPTNAPAAFGFEIGGRFIRVLGTARTDSDFGVRTITKRIPEANPVLMTHVILWGTPGDPSHDLLRGANCGGGFGLSWEGSGFCESGNGTSILLSPSQTKLPEILTAMAVDPVPFDEVVKPFLSMGTDCNDAGPTTILRMDSWEDPAALDPFGEPIVGDPNLLSYPLVSPQVVGCHKLVFDPKIEIQPSITNSDSPTGVSVALDVPQNEVPDSLATPHLRKAIVTLPEGMTINPAAADGIQGCSPSEIGLTNTNPIRFTKTDSNCPQASKVGTVEVTTPLLPDIFRGDAYLATPRNNAFGSLVSLYLVLRGPGIVIKLAGKVEPDPVTGQLKTTFDQNPQLPFDEFRLNFFGGPRAPLSTPQTCGTKTISTEMTPWSAPQSGPPALRSSSYSSTTGPNYGPCSGSLASRPFNPGLAAGTTNPVAGKTSPFAIRLTRPDGEQELAGLTVKTPKGFTGYLKGVSTCSEADIAKAAGKTGVQERDNPSCPANSRVGSLFTGAGAGPTPLFTPGTAYLAGPYKGAPLSMATVTPALAGGTPGNPAFDLGTVVVRVALHVDSKTAQITAVSDPIPQILEGIPLRVKDVRVKLDRPDFVLNPTNCSQMAVEAVAKGASGATANLSDRFQVGSCADLPFKPKFAFRLKGGTKRGGHPAFTAVVTARPGDANIGRVSATVPSSEFLDQAHIRTICTRVQFAADTCPAAAIYGKAKAITPLLDHPLEGPVYLRSSDNKLPDLVAALKGPDHQPIEIELVGRIDSIKGQIRNTFDVVPDAPVTKFTLSMQGGKKGLLVNSRDICKGTFRADVKVDAQNGKTADQRPKMVAQCGKGRKGKRAKR